MATTAAALSLLLIIVGSSVQKKDSVLYQTRKIDYPVLVRKTAGPSFVHPTQALALEARDLPVERYYETDGVLLHMEAWKVFPLTSARVLGAMRFRNGFSTPFRVYPDGREEFGAPKDFTMAWGPCNVAIQDC
ncbi:hypothetical protein GUITHDRAFT_138875 [Guillardia theta CCMP2712]|uniref:Uncharacterized protein n=1 Tax=Guillardia theta (strain CCMP2712) TaxID=905079 RepID=L1JC52_GUITC|nr:hypothetical protein GUITHDRAFT_138875 [Guillardia theta CCMP2712]EKX45670.1 hypothetical protein GUITHDRAFT_138875 [Guillardia theta CCMP2712]|eukprot:XP_005832650.1 hypothetical protein GUITHDRAFT_138875 [Guillardia theta CCMP2712]